MDEIMKKIDLLDYIKTPLTESSIAVLYSGNNIKYDKCVLFNDYIQSLLCLIFDTYLGDDTMSNKDIINHFKWCWDKNISNFNLEGITFNNTNESMSYLQEFTMEIYYSVKEKELKPHLCNNIHEIWANLFDFNSVKTRSDVDNLIDIYKILDKSLKNN